MSVYKRGKVWWIRFQFRGEDIREPAHTGIKRVAEAHERKRREECGILARGGKPRRSYDETAARFIREHLPTLKPTSQRRYVTSMKMLDPDIGHLHLDQITRSKLSEIETRRRRDGASPPTIRRDFACLSSIFGCALDWEWVEVNPVPPYLRSRRKRGLRESPPRTRYLYRDEEAVLLPHAAPHLAPIIAFAIDTGLRLSEQTALTWPRVDLRRQEITVINTKAGVSRIVPLLERSAQILAQSLRHISSPYVFCHPDGAPYTRFNKGLAGAARRGGIEGLIWHDLRRTCGCRLLQDHPDMDIKKVANWLGHASVAVTERSYAFLEVDDLHAATRTNVGTGRADSPTSKGPAV